MFVGLHYNTNFTGGGHFRFSAAGKAVRRGLEATVNRGLTTEGGLARRGKYTFTMAGTLGCPLRLIILKKTKKTRSPPVSPFLSPLASPPAMDPGFPRLQIRAARGGRRGAAGRAPASRDRGGGPGVVAVVEGGRRAEPSSPAGSGHSAPPPTGSASGRRHRPDPVTARRHRPDPPQDGLVVAVPQSVEEEVAAAGSRERKREE